MNYSKFKTIDFSQLTSEEHIEQLKSIIALFILYGDEETFKKVLMKDDTDYTLLLIRDLKIRGMI